MSTKLWGSQNSHWLHMEQGMIVVETLYACEEIIISCSHLVTHCLARCNLYMTCPTWALTLTITRKKGRKMTSVVRCDEDGPRSSSFHFFFWVRNVTLHILYELFSSHRASSKSTKTSIRDLYVHNWFKHSICAPLFKPIVIEYKWFVRPFNFYTLDASR